MASNTQAFFVGVGTTFVILAIGFGGGLLLATNALEPAPSAAARPTAGPLPPPARVILPAFTESAQKPPSPAAAPETAPQVNPNSEVPPSIEHNERAEHRKAESQRRERRSRVAERRAKRDARRIAKQRQEQQHKSRQPGIMAFGGDNDRPSFGGGFFGN